MEDDSIHMGDDSIDMGYLVTLLPGLAPRSLAAQPEYPTVEPPPRKRV